MVPCRQVVQPHLTRRFPLPPLLPQKYPHLKKTPTTRNYYRWPAFGVYLRSHPWIPQPLPYRVHLAKRQINRWPDSLLALPAASAFGWHISAPRAIAIEPHRFEVRLVHKSSNPHLNFPRLLGTLFFQSELVCGHELHSERTCRTSHAQCSSLSRVPQMQATEPHSIPLQAFA